MAVLDLQSVRNYFAWVRANNLILNVALSILSLRRNAIPARLTQTTCRFTGGRPTPPCHPWVGNTTDTVGRLRVLAGAGDLNPSEICAASGSPGPTWWSLDDGDSLPVGRRVFRRDVSRPDGSPILSLIDFDAGSHYVFSVAIGLLCAKEQSS